MVIRDRLFEMQQLIGIEEGKQQQQSGVKNEQAARPVPIIDRRNKESFEQFMTDVDEIRHSMMTLTMDREAIRIEQVESLASGAADTVKTRRLNEHVDQFILKARALRERLGKANANLANFPECGYGAGRARHEQIRVLNMSFETIMLKFNEEQIEYKESAARKIVDYMRKQNIEVSDSQIHSAIESGNLFQLTRNIHLGVHAKKALFEDVKSRATDILVIEKQIREISELFLDMHMMVAQQGETIERIETSVTNAQEYAAKADRNVKSAVVLRRRGRKGKIIFLIVGMVLILLALVLLKFLSPF
uniref:t-SNARE coiled-coil homology domain-containing protein n=1 Tax=Caenorhabditis japonica TaxID=281687 RepID=A0A8R1E1A2_CAEJA